MVSDIYWSNEMTSGASWLQKTTFNEARDLPVNLSRQSSSASKKADSSGSKEKQL